RAWLLATAKVIARELKQRSGGTSLRIRLPGPAIVSDTDGWYTGIGTLGGRQVRLEIWLDRFSGYTQRKLYAGFYTKHRRRVIDIPRRVSRKLVPHRVVTLQDIREGKRFILAERLSKSEFNFPLLEKYDQGITYYGFYDPTPGSSLRGAHIFALAQQPFLSPSRARFLVQHRKARSVRFSHKLRIAGS